MGVGSWVSNTAQGAGNAIEGGLGSVGNFLGFTNPYAGAPALATPNAGAYRPDLSGVNNSLGMLQQFAQSPGLQVNQGASQADAMQQQGLIDMLLGTANGTGGPSAAQVQLGQGLDTALAQGRSMAQSVAQQTGNPIAALQAAGGQQSLLQRQVLGDTANLRAQEQLAARQQLEQALSSKRYGDVTDTAQRLQADTANRQVQMQSLADILSGNLNTAQLQQYGQMAFEQARMASQNAARQEYVNSRAQEAANRRQLLSTLLQVGGTIAGAAIGGGVGGGAIGGAIGGALPKIIGGSNYEGVPTGGYSEQDQAYAAQLQNRGFVSGGDDYGAKGNLDAYSSTLGGDSAAA